MANKKIKINRAPVLTLWATIVAERLGYKKDESLTFGKAVAGLNAQSKGKRLGIYEEKKDKEEGEKETKEKKQPGWSSLNCWDAEFLRSKRHKDYAHPSKVKRSMRRASKNT